MQSEEPGRADGYAELVKAVRKGRAASNRGPAAEIAGLFQLPGAVHKIGPPHNRRIAVGRD